MLHPALFDDSDASSFTAEQVVGLLRSTESTRALLEDTQLKIRKIALGQSTWEKREEAILLHPHQTLTQAVTGAILALRQHHYDKFPFQKTFDPKAVVALARFRRADSFAHLAKFFLEMSLQREARLAPQTIIPQEDWDTGIELIRKDFRYINNGMLLAHFFERWFFVDSRVTACDKETVSSLLAGCIQTGDEEIRNCHLFQLTHIPETRYGRGNSSYLPSVNRFNWVEEAFLTEVRDRSTSNFLWFLKFEHAMKKQESNQTL